MRSDQVTHTRQLGIPRRATVTADANGRPSRVDGREVESIRESWLLEDRWWTEHPLQRRYWEVVTTSGSDEVVFHDLRRDRWWRQRA